GAAQDPRSSPGAQHRPALITDLRDPRCAGRREGAPPRLAVLTPRAPRKSNVPPQLHACAGVAGSPRQCPFPPWTGVAHRDRAVRVDAARRATAGAGTPERRPRSRRARAQLRGDATFTSRACGEDREAIRRPRSRGTDAAVQATLG